MNEHNHIHIPMLLITSIISIWLSLLTSLSQSQSLNYSICKEELYNCGDLSNISYPFWGQNRAPECGGGNPFELKCQKDNSNYTTIGIESQNLQVIDINTTANTIRMRREFEFCSPKFDNTTNINSTVFQYHPSVQNITIFYNCSHPYTFPCEYWVWSGNQSGNGYGNVTYYRGEEYEVLIKHPDLWNCEGRVQVQAIGAPPDPNEEGAGLDILQNLLQDGFDVYYNVSEECKNCWTSGGVCGSDAQQNFCCYCPDGSSSSLQCPHSKRNQWQMKVVIGIISAMATIAGVLICIIIFSFGLCKSSAWQRKFWLVTKSNQDIEAFLKHHGALAQKRYKFSEIKRMTNSFKDKLGQGGYGAVYKGKLPTGCFVAVKLLHASKGNGEEFINEVASISGTSHVNVVTLVGFCYEGRKKALIYEFMTNGSLERFIFKGGTETIPSLSWENMYQIAISIARGLEYLHRGCNTRILHFDIKPHNILLDENFNPKISDFGLAKLCPRNKSIVSMSDPRGTIGYLAPEMSNKRFGGVSHKSDVYSYGMILLDMVEGRKNNNVEATHTSEKYFPDWIYNKVEQGDMRSDGVMGIEENEIARRITVVGLWCIQTFPNDRPTMSRVIEMLEGSKNHVEIPPKPFLSSPP